MTVSYTHLDVYKRQIQGIPYSNRMKDRINQMTTYAEFETMLKLYEEALISGNFDRLYLAE